MSYCHLTTPTQPECYFCVISVPSWLELPTQRELGLRLLATLWYWHRPTKQIPRLVMLSWSSTAHAVWSSIELEWVVGGLLPRQVQGDDDREHLRLRLSTHMRVQWGCYVCCASDGSKTCVCYLSTLLLICTPALVWICSTKVSEQMLEPSMNSEFPISLQASHMSLFIMLHMFRWSDHIPIR